MKITKDTEVAILVDGCSLKEKQLVYNWLSKPSPSNTSWLHMATTLRNGGWNDQGKKRDKKFYNKEGIKLISFKKFLKAVNPYKGELVYIDNATPETVKRAKKMGYETNGVLVVSSLQVLQIGTSDAKRPWYYAMEHNHDCHSGADEIPHITHEQFMNLEPLAPVSPPLRFQNWDVSVEENTIKVGCETVQKQTLRHYLAVAQKLHAYHIPLAEGMSFIKQHKEELGLT